MGSHMGDVGRFFPAPGLCLKGGWVDNKGDGTLSAPEPAALRAKMDTDLITNYTIVLTQYSAGRSFPELTTHCS